MREFGFVLVRTPVASRGGVIELNHARQSSRSVRTPRVWMPDIDTVYFIRFDSRVGCFRASSRRASSREMHSSFSHSPILSCIHPHAPRRRRSVLVQVCTRSSLEPCNIYFFQPRRRSSSSSSSPTPWTRTARRRVPPSHRARADAYHLRSLFASFVFARSSDATRAFSRRSSRGYFSVPHSSVRCARSSIDAVGGRRNVSSATDRTVGVFFFCVCRRRRQPEKYTALGISIDGDGFVSVVC